MSTSKNGKAMLYKSDVLKVFTTTWTKLKESDIDDKLKGELQYMDNYLQKQIRALDVVGAEAGETPKKQSKVLSTILS